MGDVLRLDPATTALVTMECQRGVIGDLAAFAHLADAVREAGVLDRLVELATAFRRSGALVVHAVAVVRPGRAGTPANAPLLRAAARAEVQLVEGTPPAAVVGSLWDPGDTVAARHTGVSPFGPTDLADRLRGAGITTVVAAGVSLNVGVVGLCIGAVDHGFEVVVARDATIAVPPEVGATILGSTIAPLARLATVDEISAALAPPAR